MEEYRQTRELRLRYAAAIRLERLRANMTQTEFAEVLGVSLASVQAWEVGRKLPRPVLRRRLVGFFPRLAGVWDKDEEDTTDEGGTRPGT